MPSDSGIDAARYIRNLDCKSIIIIVTSHHESAEEIYKGRFNILTFISKYDRCEYNFVLAVRDAIRYLVDDKDVITFTDLGNNYSINAKDILYLTKDGRKTVIKTNYEEYEVYTSLDKLKHILPPYFKQSHRACIVNTQRITKINYAKKIISFDNGVKYDMIGDKYKKELL